MTPHITDRLSEYMDRELPPAVRALVQEHLAECDACSRHLGELAALDNLARGLAQPAPVDAASFAARVRSRLGERARPVRRGLPVWTLAAAAALLLAVLTPLSLREIRRQPAEPAGAVRQLERPAASAAPQAQEEDRSPLPKPAADERARDAFVGRKAKAAEAPQTLPPLAEAGPSQPADVGAGRLPAAPQPAPVAAPPAAEPAQEAFARAPAARSEKEGLADAVEAKRNSAQGASDAPAPLQKSRLQAASPGRENKTEATERTGAVGSAAAGASEGRYQELITRSTPGTSDEARASRDSWRAFALENPGSARADEARVRSIELLALAYRLGGEERDRDAARQEALDYLRQARAPQAPKVRVLLASLDRR